MEVTDYNIHDKLKVRIRRERRFDLMKGINLEFDAFKVEHVDEPDVELNVARFVPEDEGSLVVDHKYHIKNNYFYCKDSKNDLKWEIEIFGFEKGKMVINYYYETLSPRKIVSRSALENFFLKPVIYQKLCEKDCLMIHAAAVAKNSKAYVIAGRGGSFKTSMVMDFIRRGRFRYMSDDRAILCKGDVLNFPTSLSLFNYLYGHKENEHMGFLDKLRYILELNVKNSGIELPSEGRGELAAILFVVKQNRKSGIYLKSLDKKTAVDKIIENCKQEMRADTVVVNSPYYEYMLVYSYIFPESGPGNYFEALRARLDEALHDTYYYEISYPGKYDRSIYERVSALVGTLS